MKLYQNNKNDTAQMPMLRSPPRQFSLRTLLLILAVGAVVCSWYLVQRVGPDEILIRDTEEEGFLWHRGHALRVRLDLARLRDWNLTREDVLKALTPSSMIGKVRQSAPAAGIMIETNLLRQDQYENIILRATPTGDVVRLKEVGTVEAAW